MKKKKKKKKKKKSKSLKKLFMNNLPKKKFRSIKLNIQMDVPSTFL